MAAVKKKKKMSKQREVTHKSSVSWTWILLVVVCAVLIGVGVGSSKYREAPTEGKVYLGECISFIDMEAKQMSDPVFSINDFGPSCPFVARRAAIDTRWLGTALWSRFKRYASRVDSDVALDVIRRRNEYRFKYWDNNSLLASTTLALNRTRPNYERWHMRPHEALMKILNAKLGMRYGGTAVNFLGEEAEYELFNLAKRFWPQEKECTTRRMALWLGTEDTESSPHYDSFHNAFLVLAGQKHIILAPSSCSKLYDIYPATHPEARQAKSIVTTNCPSNYSTTLNPGDLVYIPAGWIHHFSVGHIPSAAVSLTTLPKEFHHFTQWVQHVPKALPFLQRAIMKKEQWSHQRLIASIICFARHLHRELEHFDQDDKLSDYTLTSVFGSTALAAYRDLAARAYDDETRHTLGIAPRRLNNEPCPWSTYISDQDATAAAQAAAQVALTFKQQYRPSLRYLYLAPYLENVLSKVALPRLPHNTTLTALLDLIDLCLLDTSA